jgi:hypothetical protein
MFGAHVRPSPATTSVRGDRRGQDGGGPAEARRGSSPGNRQPFIEMARAALRDLHARATTLGADTNVRA